MYKRIARALFAGGFLCFLSLSCFQIQGTRTEEPSFCIPEEQKQVSIIPNDNPVTFSDCISYDETYQRIDLDGNICCVDTNAFPCEKELILEESNGTRYINELTVSIYDSPFSSANVIDTLSLNTQVELHSKTKSDYYKINANDVEGFIHQDYLSETVVNYVTDLQKEILYRATNDLGTKPCTHGFCAAWVSGIYQAAGLGYPGGHAIDYWTRCSCSGSTSMENIPIGAVVIGSGSGSEDGNKYGHVAIYVGNGMVAENAGFHRVISLKEWAAKQKGYCRGYHGYIGWVWPYGQALGDGI